MAEKQEKKQKRKPKYGMLSCAAYMFNMLWRHERGLALTGILLVPWSLGAAALGLYIPVIVIEYLEISEHFSAVGLVILGLSAADLLLSLTGSILQNKKDTAELYIVMRMKYYLQKYYLERDFYLDYDPEVQVLDQRAQAGSESNYAGAVCFPMRFVDILSTVLKFILFGSVVSVLSPYVILLIALGCAASIPLSAWERKRNYATRDDRGAISKKLNYLSGDVAKNFKYGKDIRLYGLGEPLFSLGKALLGQSRREHGRVLRRNFVTALTGFLVVLVRDGAVYGFLIARAVAGELDAAGFVLYFTAVTQMAGVLSGILQGWSGICEGALQVSDYREALEVTGSMNRGKGIPLPQGPFSIEFRNVTFRYKGAEKNVLENISFKIQAGEKAALVGLNGAGKTTITKLMCGLLLPTEGEVLLDGHALQEYNREELYSLFGLVPQNFNLLPMSIARNIACTSREEEIDRERLGRCSALAGLEEKIEGLPLGADTPLDRQLNPDGVALSGGETQKLLLARLLYRSPRCMILDEPTAALDPIAEDRMYHRYSEMSSHATSVFISHRLASTRFCDRIFYLENARIRECGTHGELMAAGGRYQELYEVQSRYYKEEAQGQEGAE